MRERCESAESKESPDSNQSAGSNDEWRMQGGGVMYADPYILSPLCHTNASEQVPAPDQFTMGDINNTSVHTNTEDYTDVWNEELYRIIMDPGDIRPPFYGDRGLLFNPSSDPESSLDIPDLPNLEENISNEQTTPGILEKRVESPWREGGTDCPSSGGESPVHDSPTSADPTGTRTVQDISLTIYPELGGSSVELVPFYFNVVCPILSTFDSEKNVFRTFVTKKWQNSVAMFCTIQSMAAAKLVWFMPYMRAPALEWRSRALENLQKNISAAPYWDTELLFIVLLLGVSSSWFEIADLGIAHLKAVQQAIQEGKVKFSDDDLDMAGFFRNALIYWEMVLCAVSHTVNYANVELEDAAGPRPQPPTRQEAHEVPARMVPHPWTGVAPEPQAIFTRISRQIHTLRTSGSASVPGGPGLEQPDEFIRAVRELDEAAWSYNLPELHDISNVGDPNTPAVHHLLLAEAYMLANLYQLYFVFSNVRAKRVRWIKDASALRQFDSMTWAGGQVCSWARILRQEDGTEKWLRFLGHSVIIRLEQIQTTSGTSCVQALLLLVAATSLSSNSRAKEEVNEEDTADDLEILRLRQFVLYRLDFLSASNLSAPIQYVRNVVVEIFKRLDVGVDIIWMDVMQAMGLLTIVG